MVSCSGLTEKDNHNKESKYFEPSNQASLYTKMHVRTWNSGWAVCKELTLNRKNTALVRRTGQG